ncbi:MAG: glycosyl hydrolase family 95 catalytic domain-containing protein [Planctomycetota bacterium]|jgi:alpha-L-fucosidase 2
MLSSERRVGTMALLLVLVGAGLTACRPATRAPRPIPEGPAGPAAAEAEVEAGAAPVGEADGGPEAPAAPVPTAKEETAVEKPVPEAPAAIAEWDDEKSPCLKLRYSRPARDWMKEALPIGNGRLGCMIFGGIEEERIQFNEDSMWTGDENPSGSYGSMGGYQAFGDLYVSFVKAAGGAAAATPARAAPGVKCSSGHKAYYDKEGVKSTHDGDPNTKWCVEHKGRAVVWELTLPEGEGAAVKSYAFTSGNDSPPRDPKTWVLEASADGKKWVELDRREGEKPFRRRRERRKYDFANDTKYERYRIRFIAVNGGPRLQLGEIALAGVSAPASGGRAAADAAPAGVTGYGRELDLRRAVHRVSYTKDGVAYAREYFASNPDQAMVFRYTADAKAKLTGAIRLTDMHDAKPFAEGNRLRTTGALANDLKYEAQVLVLNEGGKLAAGDGQVLFRGCDSLTLVLAAGTDYLDDYEKNWRRDHPHERVTREADSAAKRPYPELLARHVRDHASLFGRVELDNGRTAEDARALPTDERLKRYAGGGSDPELENILFQYGRYLIIGSSRPGCLPANLQGLWNHKNSAPWHSDYHSNINVQMNYWLTEPANLPECHRPFLRMIYQMREPSRKATLADKRFNNARGWTTRTSHNIFGGHGWKWNIPGGAWYAQHMWEHYSFGMDKGYLKDMAYPVLKEMCEFWEDYLKQRPDGTLVVPMGWSPEHGPTEDGTSYDQQIVWDLFTNYVDAADALGVDKAYRDKIAAMRGRLLGPKIGKWGQLQEWETDRDNPKDHHRHVSHLFAVHPGRQIGPAKTPKLAAAATVSLNARGDGGTGWSKSWKISFWARLLDGDHSYKMLSELLKRNIMPNFYDTHPPFQIDGNFGATAGVCEMLLQSHLGELHLLSALPSAWATGSVKGLRGRGGFEVDMTWKDSELVEAVIRSRAGLPCKVRYGEKVIDLPAREGGTFTLDGELRVR